MDPTTVWDILFKQGPIVSIMAAIIWFVIKAYKELFQLFLAQQREHNAVLVQTINTNTTATQANTAAYQAMTATFQAMTDTWKSVRERLNVPPHA